MQIMKKLLFIFTLAAICAVTTTSFKSTPPVNEDFKQTLVVVSAYDVDSPEDVKNDKKKQQQAATSSCCQAKAEKPECTEKQQQSCAASKVECPAAKKSEKK